MYNYSYPDSLATDPKSLILQRLADPCRLLQLLRLPYKQRSPHKCTINCPTCESASCGVNYVSERGIVLWRCPKCGAAGDAFRLIAIVHHLDVRRDFPRVLELGARISGMDPAVVQRRGATIERPRKEDMVDFNDILTAIAAGPAPKPRRPAIQQRDPGEDEDIVALLADLSGARS